VLLSSVLQFPTFRRIIVLASSGLGSEAPKTYHETGISMLIIFTCYSCVCAGDKIEKNEMGWACGAYG